MRRRDREINDLYEIESILDNAMVCSIGFAVGGDPNIVPVCFGYTNGTIYPHSTLSGKNCDAGEKSKVLF